MASSCLELSSLQIIFSTERGLSTDRTLSMDGRRVKDNAMAEVPVCLCVLWDPCPWHILHAPLTCGPSGLRAVTCCVHTMTGVWVLLLIQGSRRWPRGRGTLQSLFSKWFHSWSFFFFFWQLEKLILVHMALTQSRSQVAKVSWRLVFCQFYAWLPKATPASWQDGVACQAITLQNPCGYICCEINSSRLLFPFES